MEVTETMPGAGAGSRELPMPLPPLGALRRFWVIGLLFALLGLAAGVAAGNTRPVTYTAQASLAVGGQDLSSFQVAGFALAAQQIASNYARYVGLPQSQATFKKVLGANEAKVVSVSGSPISNSNIILVEVVATDRTVAVNGSNAIAAELMRQANAPAVERSAAVYLSHYQAVSDTLFAAQTRENAAKVRLATMVRHKATAPALAIQQNRVNAVSTTVATLLVQQKTLEAQYTNALTNETTYSQLVSAQTAVITLISRRSTLERYGVAGLVLGGGLGLCVAVLLDRASVRRRRRRLSRLARVASRPRPLPVDTVAADPEPWLAADRTAESEEPVRRGPGAAPQETAGPEGAGGQDGADPDTAGAADAVPAADAAEPPEDAAIQNSAIEDPTVEDPAGPRERADADADADWQQITAGEDGDREVVPEREGSSQR